ncbi:hypothetical protein DPMN_168847 [Dreissena polymorpha]|uniref:Uncharacterized protein n=1 Tax=Dreissena polymorpha TaxID=45954 RepID=A0A9D4J011_DREPO|nr:hypothetical protein DPMN_168847 [Dreissena polymorpha]
MNPADLTSRGLLAYEKEKLNIWLNGPDFLLKGKSDWPSIPQPLASLSDDI